MTKKNEPTFSYSRYAMIGGGLGLYFGLFYRPPDRALSLITPLLLAMMVAVVMTGLAAWRQRPSLAGLPAQFAVTLVKASLVLLVLEGRLLAYDMGGKTAVTVFTVIMGTLTGLWFAYDQKRLSLSSETNQR